MPLQSHTQRAGMRSLGQRLHKWGQPILSYQEV